MQGETLNFDLSLPFPRQKHLFKKRTPALAISLHKIMNLPVYILITVAAKLITHVRECNPY